MTWNIYGEPIGDSVDVYQPFKPGKNIVLKAIRTQFIILDDPSFTAISLKILTSNGVEIAESQNSYTKAELMSDNSGVYDRHFEFDHDIWLNKDTWYRAKPIITGYSYSSGSHIALRKVWPNSQYPDSYTAHNTKTALIESPYFLELFGTSN